jgi:hypothetical protein
MSTLLTENLRTLLSKVAHGSDELATLSVDERHDRLKGLVKLWIVVKVSVDKEICNTLIATFLNLSRRTGTSSSLLTLHEQPLLRTVHEQQLHV